MYICEYFGLAPDKKKAVFQKKGCHPKAPKLFLKKYLIFTGEYRGNSE